MTSNARRYRSLIEATLDHALAARAAGPMPSNVASSPAEHAGPCPMDALLPLLAQERNGPANEAKASWSIPTPASYDFVDGAGHRRPPYRGLAMRLLLSQIALSTQHVQAFVEQRSPSMHRLVAGGIQPAAPFAGDVLAVVFDAGAIEAAPRALPSAREVAHQCFTRLVNAQQADGTFLARTGSDNPEPLWYAELALLHAVHVHAVEHDDAAAKRAADRAAHYLAAEVQPDHASAQPWAIGALLETPDGIPLADTMLHVAGVQEPATMDAVSLLLLADAWRCGRRAESG